MSFSIVPVGDCFAVYDANDVCVGGPYNRFGKAQATMKGHETRLKKASEVKIRNCMTCGAKFESEGIHNRLCPTHRRASQPVAL